MKNADMPAMPLYEVIEDCGVDGNQGPYLVSREETGLTKREHFAAMAMQGILSDPDDMQTSREAAQTAVFYADALLAALEKQS